MPVLRSRQTGDMYVQVVVETPQNLTKKQQELLAEFEKLSSGATQPEAAGFFTKVKDFFGNRAECRRLNRSCLTVSGRAPIPLCDCFLTSPHRAVPPGSEMPLQSSARALKKPLRLDDEVRFLRSWIEKPLHMGAVMPSGRVLARTMAQYVDVQSEGPVVELGPGTGAITNALIEHGVDQKRLVLVEYNPGFCALLRDRYPHAKVVQGDAYTLRDTLRNVLNAPASAVVSGLPLVTKPMLTRLKLIRDAFVALAPGAPFVQFTYSVAPPIPKSLPGVSTEASERIWMNLPPARVWVYRKG